MLFRYFVGSRQEIIPSEILNSALKCGQPTQMFNAYEDLQEMGGADLCESGTLSLALLSIVLESFLAHFVILIH